MFSLSFYPGESSGLFPMKRENYSYEAIREIICIKRDKSRTTSCTFLIVETKIYVKPTLDDESFKY